MLMISVSRLDLGHAATISTLSYAIRFWSKGTKRALFLRHEGFLYVLPLLICFASNRPGLILSRNHFLRSNYTEEP